ncbi:hypothetical protein F0U59_21365 [Archangium gephyra]|nr:hypothetical protein F0U59_21365 [Archangium gephyra]
MRKLLIPGLGLGLLGVGLLVLALRFGAPANQVESHERKLAVMNDEELLGKTLHVAREAGLLLLRKHGTVLPFGLTLDSAGDNPRTFFPRDQLPRASWDELLEATIGHLERSAGSADVGAIALVTTLESGSESGLGVQVETHSSSLFLVYPYSGTGQSLRLGEPQKAEGVLVGPILAQDD